MGHKALCEVGEESDVQPSNTAHPIMRYQLIANTENLGLGVWPAKISRKGNKFHK